MRQLALVLFVTLGSTLAFSQNECPTGTTVVLTTKDSKGVSHQVMCSDANGGLIVIAKEVGSTESSAVRGTRYVDGISYPRTDTGLRSALADCAADSGGEVVVLPGPPISVLSPLDVGTRNAVPATPCVLSLKVGAILDFGSTFNGGTSGIRLWNASTLKCDLSMDGPASTNNAAKIRVSGATLTDLISNGDMSGNQETAWIEGCYFVYESGSVLNAIHFAALGAPTHITNFVVDNFPQVGVRIESPAGLPASATSVDHCWINGEKQPGARPLLLGAQSSSNLGPIAVHDCTIEHAGSGNPMIDVQNASYAAGLSSVSFRDIYMEAIQGNVAIGININNGFNIRIDNVQCGGGPAASGSVCIDISGTAPAYVLIDGAYNAGWTYTLQDHIDGISYTQSQKPVLEEYCASCR